MTECNHYRSLIDLLGSELIYIYIKTSPGSPFPTSNLVISLQLLYSAVSPENLLA